METKFIGEHYLKLMWNGSMSNETEDIYFGISISCCSFILFCTVVKSNTWIYFQMAFWCLGLLSDSMKHTFCLLRNIPFVYSTCLCGLPFQWCHKNSQIVFVMLEISCKICNYCSLCSHTQVANLWPSKCFWTPALADMTNDMGWWELYSNYIWRVTGYSSLSYTVVPCRASRIRSGAPDAWWKRRLTEHRSVCAHGAVLCFCVCAKRQTRSNPFWYFQVCRRCPPKWMIKGADVRGGMTVIRTKYSWNGSKI